jgi:oxalate---CoA ligase
MDRFQNILALISHADPSAVALRAPDSLPLTYGALKAQVEETVKALNAWGIGRGDRVAILLPNGATMASAFIATACGAVAAPLNPGYRADEIEFYLSDLQAKALIVSAEAGAPARQIAEKLGLAVLTLTTLPEAGAGAFVLHSSAEPLQNSHPADDRFAAGEDIALILHTSGTTSRPKIVPLTHQNVCASACNVRDNLNLGHGDTGLNIMPLFHIHGLIAGLLAPLSGGGKVFCTPGFNALKFFTWMKEACPTWYTAVPTMHQAILPRAAHNRDVIRAHPLRFLRSSSSSIPSQVIRDLEETFSAPLVESYGMTEAAHQMASNPLPPAVRKPGTVGVAAGPEIAVLTVDGNVRTRSAAGEVVIRGANVTAGYLNNPDANREGFINGWFRTGDLGLLDEEGYLSITGRLKEIINRGGEKISPREIDELIMDHPAIAQVVTFGMPHPKLGETVGVAAVLRSGHELSAQELKAFVGKRVADFKVPSTIVFLKEIPKGATGKPQRMGLAEQLGLV